MPTNSRRYRKRRSGRTSAQHVWKNDWALFSRRSSALWLYGALFALILGFFVQHLVHEMILDIVVYASSTDTTVSSWANQLRAAGYHVHVIGVSDPHRVRRQLGVPDDLAACHTAITVVGRYVLEGDVPAERIKELLASRPDIRGLAAIRGSETSTGRQAIRVVPFARSAAR